MCAAPIEWGIIIFPGAPVKRESTRVEASPVHTIGHEKTCQTRCRHAVFRSVGQRNVGKRCYGRFCHQVIVALECYCN